MPVIQNRGRLFLACCIALTGLAMTFSIRADILSALGKEFDISHERQGLINAAICWGYPVAILFGGALCDALGMGRLMALAWSMHIAGLTLTLLSPKFGFSALLLAMFVIGLADGTVEAVMNPLVATLYPENRTGRLSALHAAWPLGLIVGGILCLAISPLFGLGRSFVPASVLSLSWKVKWMLIFFPVLAYGALMLGQKFPHTERKAAGVPFWVMFRESFRPGFLVLLFCMIFTAVTEIGPDQWVGSVMTDTVGIRGIVFLVYGSVIMFVMRIYGGALVRLFTPFGLLAGSCVMATAGLYWLGFAFSPLPAFAGATLFGMGKTCLWPTLLGITADRYPKGGSFLLAVLGAAAMLAGGAAGPLMGRVYDKYTIKHLPASIAGVVVADGRYSPASKDMVTDPADRLALREAEKRGAAMTFRFVAAMPILPFFIFVFLGFYHRSRGGYRPVSISGGPPGY